MSRRLPSWIHRAASTTQRADRGPAGLAAGRGGVRLPAGRTALSSPALSSPAASSPAASSPAVSNAHALPGADVPVAPGQANTLSTMACATPPYGGRNASARSPVPRTTTPRGLENSRNPSMP